MNLDHTLSIISRFVRFSLTLVVGSLLVLAGTPAAHAQVDRASLEGTVSDPSGGVIVGATVKVAAVETGLTEERKKIPRDTTDSRGWPWVGIR